VSLHTLNPLADSRWADLVARDPRASAFHEPGWLEALARTYGYEPFVITSASPGKALRNGMVLCRVSSWLTRNRLVSLPFSDHCDPLVEDPRDLTTFVEFLKQETTSQRGRYLELRPAYDLAGTNTELAESRSYCWHVLDLTPSLQEIFENFHPDSIQRKIRRAEREGLGYETGCSASLQAEFYGLLQKTRRRHGLLPQPRAWFRNLSECLGPKLDIHVARKGKIAIAALLTIRGRSAVVYKYGCSDERYHPLGGMPLLFWKLVGESKRNGASQIDLGRSDLDGRGLITFKNRLGAKPRSLKYYRFPKVAPPAQSGVMGPHLMRWVMPLLPDPLAATLGGMLYKHMG